MSAENDIAPDPEGETAASDARPRNGVSSQVVDVGAGEADVPEDAEPPPSSAAETGNAVRALVARLKPGTIIGTGCRIGDGATVRGNFENKSVVI